MKTLLGDIYRGLKVISLTISILIVILLVIFVGITYWKIAIPVGAFLFIWGIGRFERTGIL